MAYGTRVTFDAVREIAFGSVSGAYAAVGTPLADHVRLITFNSSLDQDIYVSFDGTTDHLRMAQNSFKLYDLSSNKVRDDGLFIASGTQIYIKEVSASVTEGTFWFESMSAQGGK
tara:strand:+ start:1039 stop:1383 length:345 start_codon:yes stop_codon:yes gene_type:complete